MLALNCNLYNKSVPSNTKDEVWNGNQCDRSIKYCGREEGNDGLSVDDIPVRLYSQPNGLMMQSIMCNENGECCRR